MKVICMDCQNESFSDLESLKTNRSVICAQCTEKSRAYSDHEIGAGALLELNEPVEPYSSSLQEFLPASEIPARDEDILELSDEFIVSDQPGYETDNEVILLPEIETQSALPEEALHLDQFDNSLLGEAPPVSETGSGRVSPDADFSCALPEQETDPLSGSQLSEILPAGEVEGIKRMRLMSFSTSKQIAIAGACVLSIILMQMLVARPGQVSVKTESSGKPVASALPEAGHQKVSAPVQVSQNMPAPAPPPTPAPVAVEKPVAAALPPTAQPAEKQQGLYTVQVGAHQDEAEANDQAGKFRAAGFEPRVVSAEIPNRGVWYRVQLGDFGSRDEANRFGAALRTKGLADNFIISAL